MTSSDNPLPRQVKRLSGRVVRAPFGAGSKSEHQATWIETDLGRFVLRRKAGPAFGDAALDQWVGRQVRCDGWVAGRTVLAERIDADPERRDSATPSAAKG